MHLPPRRVALAVLLLLAASGCGWFGPDRPRVLIVGDSITNLVEDDFRAEPEQDYEYTMRATDGATAAEMLPWAQDVSSIDYEQVILNLGTNDVNEGLPAETTRASIEDMVALFPEADCIHLVNLNEHMMITSVDAIHAVNEQLDELAAADPRIRIIDWDAAVTAHLGSGGDPVLTDTVHPTDAGQALILELYLDALHDCG